VSHCPAARFCCSVRPRGPAESVKRAQVCRVAQQEYRHAAEDLRSLGAGLGAGRVRLRSRGSPVRVWRPASASGALRMFVERCGRPGRTDAVPESSRLDVLRPDRRRVPRRRVPRRRVPRRHVPMSHGCPAAPRRGRAPAHGWDGVVVDVAGYDPTRSATDCRCSTTTSRSSVVTFQPGIREAAWDEGWPPAGSGSGQ